MEVSRGAAAGGRGLGRKSPAHETSQRTRMQDRNAVQGDEAEEEKTDQKPLPTEVQWP